MNTWRRLNGKFFVLLSSANYLSLYCSLEQRIYVNTKKQMCECCSPLDIEPLDMLLNRSEWHIEGINVTKICPINHKYIILLFTLRN